MSHAMPRLARFLVVCVFVAVSQVATADALRVRDLPLPENATDITYVKRRGDVRLHAPGDFKSVGAFYASQLTEQGWKKIGRDNLQSNFQVQTFSKDNATLEVRVDSRGEGSEVRLTPKGMMWEEDDQPSPKDLPLPADAMATEYDDFFESIEFTSGLGVKAVASFLTAELEQRRWNKEPTEFDFDNFVRLKFNQAKSTLEIDIRANEDGSEVAIRTKGMQWDGMKAEIKKSKLEKERAAAEAEAKQKTADMQAALQKRKERPQQGIDNLPRLPSEGTVVMNGTTHQLPHIIAFETYEDGRWSTRIVATQRAINQETLITWLRKATEDKDKNGSQPTWPQPFVQITLDDEDRPRGLSLQADGTPGSATGSNLNGSALVENGRARGTVSLKEPGSFFDKLYTAEVSFDVPLLTGESTPAKRLADAPQLASGGKLTIGDKTYSLSHLVGYSITRFDESMTKVVASEKPLNMAKLSATLGKKAADDYFEFVPQVQLVIDANENVSSLSIWADNVSISGSGNSNLASDVFIEDGRVRGTARLTEPGEFFERKYQFEVSFDLQLLGGPAATPWKAAGGLVADSYEGLPIPEDRSGTQSEGSPYRQQINTSVSAEMKAVIDFYRGELASGAWGEWKENAAQSKLEPESARLAFTNAGRNLVIQLETQDQQTAITLVTRDAQAAQAAGVLPAAGKARLVIANATEKAATISINNREYKVAALAGTENHKTGLNWEVAPGNYTVEIKPPGEQVQSEKVKLGADETWGVVIIDESGSFLAAQLY